MPPERPTLEQEIDLSQPLPVLAPVDRKPGVFVGDEDGYVRPPSQMQRIIELIEDTETTDLQEINRLIAREIALALADPTTPWTTRTATEKIKALRELARTMQDGETLSKRDFLNFDGPKFRYVLGELVQVFRSSLKSSGQSEDVVNHTLRIFRDQLKEREMDLRKETERVSTDSFFDALASSPVPPTEGTAQ